MALSPEQHYRETVCMLVIEAISLFLSLTVCFEIVLFHNLKTDQVKRLTMALMITNIVLLVSLFIMGFKTLKAATVESTSLDEMCFLDSFVDGSTALNVSVEILMLGACAYSLFGRTTAVPVVLEVLGCIICVLVYVCVQAYVNMKCISNCFNAVDVLLELTAKCQSLFADADSAILSMASISLALWIVIHIRIRQMKWVWDNKIEQAGEITRIERINKERLIALDKEALKAGYEPYAWFQAIFVLFCAAEAMYVVSRKQKLQSALNAGAVLHVIRLFFQPIAYYASREMRSNMKPKSIRMRWVQLKRRRASSYALQTNGQPTMTFAPLGTNAGGGGVGVGVGGGATETTIAFGMNSAEFDHDYDHDYNDNTGTASGDEAARDGIFSHRNNNDSSKRLSVLSVASSTSSSSARVNLKSAMKGGGRLTSGAGAADGGESSGDHNGAQNGKELPTDPDLQSTSSSITSSWSRSWSRRWSKTIAGAGQDSAASSAPKRKSWETPVRFADSLQVFLLADAERDVFSEEGVNGNSDSDSTNDNNNNGNDDNINCHNESKSSE